MTAPVPLRLRCPADSPRAADRHLAIDVRLPCDVAMLSRLAKSLPHCGCGAELVIDTKVASADAEDRSDARIADLERAASSLSDEVMQRRAERDTAMRERDALRSLRGMDAERIAKLEEMLRAVLDTAPEGGAPWVVAMARARKVLDGGER